MCVKGELCQRAYRSTCRVLVNVNGLGIAFGIDILEIVLEILQRLLLGNEVQLNVTLGGLVGLTTLLAGGRAAAVVVVVVLAARSEYSGHCAAEEDGGKHPVKILFHCFLFDLIC